MDRVGLIAKIFESVTSIDNGRKWLDIEGKVEEGRISYRAGLAGALGAFKEVEADAVEDLELLMQAEYTFIGQELEFCAATDIKTINSLTQTVEDFDSAFLVLKIVRESIQYNLVDSAFSPRSKFRYYGMPKDAFHAACSGHGTRLNNILRSPGINLAEKALLEQRLSNIRTGQSVYLKKQKAALFL